MKKLNDNIPPLKKSKIGKNSQEEEDEIRIKLHTANKAGMTGNFRYNGINFSG